MPLSCSEVTVTDGSKPRNSGRVGWTSTPGGGRLRVAAGGDESSWKTCTWEVSNCLTTCVANDPRRRSPPGRRRFVHAGAKVRKDLERVIETLADRF